MKKQTYKQIFLWLIVVILGTSCTSITKLFPREKRPFQEREFDYEQWKSGDYQMRGEMARGKLFQQIYEIKEDQKEEVRQLLGKPDEITEAVCCYSGRAGKSTNKVELWIYYIEIEEDKAEKGLRPKALKIYFDSSVTPDIGDRDGDHSYFPKIGHFRIGRTKTQVYSRIFYKSRI